MRILRGLATGIGSLPHKDAQEALDLVFKYIPNIPFWPQLPKRDIREGMIAQFSENLPCLKVSREGVFFSALDDKDRELEKFYERVIARDTAYFRIGEDFASGLHGFCRRIDDSLPETVELIKCQITGPFTFAASVKDDSGNALLHDPVFMQAILKGLTMKALWQIELFRKFNKKIVMFIDEPYLGCFGSAFTPLNREEAVSGLRELTEAIRSAGVLTGVHCCGNTDWSIFTDVESIDIINFDAFGFLDRVVLYADSLQKFLKRGGILCWGIVPTQEFSGRETPDLLIKKINDGIDALGLKGVDKDLLSDRLLLSPACGLGTLDTGSAERIFALLSRASGRLRGEKGGK